MSEVHEKMKKKDIHLFWLGSLVGLGRAHDDGPFAKRVLLFLTGCDLRVFEIRVSALLRCTRK